jgi:ubiquinone/menaquinone biosynthesis C-methylase UbiE
MVNYYDEISGSYDELYRQEQIEKLSVIKFLILKHFSINLKHKLLDVGCGNGIGQGFFSINYGCETFGIDTSKKLLEKNSYPNLYCDAENILLPDKSFDIILSLTALQNFENFEKALLEMKRICKKYLILTFLKKSSKANLIEEKIKENFILLERYEEKKDLIFILKIKTSN